MAVVPYPVIRYPGGPPRMIDLWDYEPGYAVPEVIHDDTGRNFKLDKAQKAYVPYEPQRPAPPKESYSVWDIAGGIIVGCISLLFMVFLIGLLWWIIIPAFVIAGLVWLGKKALR